MNFSKRDIYCISYLYIKTIVTTFVWRHFFSAYFASTEIIARMKLNLKILKYAFKCEFCFTYGWHACSRIFFVQRSARCIDILLSQLLAMSPVNSERRSSSLSIKFQNCNAYDASSTTTRRSWLYLVPHTPRMRRKIYERSTRPAQHSPTFCQVRCAMGSLRVARFFFFFFF